MDDLFRVGDLIVYVGSRWTATPNERDGSALIYLGQPAGALESRAWGGTDPWPHVVYHPDVGAIFLDRMAFSSWKILARL